MRNRLNKRSTLRVRLHAAGVVLGLERHPGGQRAVAVEGHELPAVAVALGRHRPTDLWAGALAQQLGYAHYFLFAVALALPGLLAAHWGRRAFSEN